MFKAQILAALVTKYPGLNKQFLGTLSEKLSAKVTEESKIEGAIAALSNDYLTVEDLADQWQKDGDRRATEAVNTFKSKITKDDNPKPEPTKPVDGETELAKQVREMGEKLQRLEAEKVQSQSKQSLLAKLKEKNIPENMAKHITLNETSNLEEIVNGLEADYNELRQVVTTDGFKQNSFTPGGSGGVTPSKAAVNADIEAWAKANEPKAKV